MIKAVAYCRYSSDRQREESIEAQLREIHNYASSHNITIVKEYIDRAVTGTLDERDSFKRMIKDSERNLFELVLTHKVDRFARNRYDSAIYKRKLRENGVKVIYVAQPISEGPEGAMMEAMLEGMAEYYSRNLAQEVMKGLKENAYDCRHCGGKAPLGYDIDINTKKYILNENEASVVRLIFDLYKKGYGYTSIINNVNNEGYRTKYGHKFGKNSIYEILRNEKYTGTYIFNRAAKKVNGKFNKRKEKDESDMIKISGGMPEIIPYDEWMETQKTLDSQKRPGRKSSEIYLLAGLLKCGVCGSAITTDTRIMKGRDKIYCYYRCYRNNGKNDCTMQAWSRDDLEDIVLEKLQKELFSGDQLEVIVNEISEYYEEHENSMSHDITKLKAELTGINKKIGNIVEAIADGGEFDSLKVKLKSLEQQKYQFESKIEEFELKRKFEIPSKTDIRKYFIKHCNIKVLSREELKQFVNEHIKNVRVYPDRIDVDVFVNIVGCGRPYTTTFTIAV